MHVNKYTNVLMISEQQKYNSGILRNVGFALLTPVGSIVFQWIMLKKSLLFEHSIYAVISFMLGWLLIFAGNIVLMEKKE